MAMAWNGRVKRQWVGALALVLAACSKESPENALATAKRSLERGELTAAQIALKGSLQQNPGQLEARLLLGRTLLLLEDPASAAIEFSKALELGAPKEQALPWLGRAYLAQHAHRKLIAELSDADMSDRAAMTDLLVLLSQSHFAIGDVKAADDALDRARLAAPDAPSVRMLTIRRQAAKNGIERSLQDLQPVLDQHPDLVEAKVLHGELLAAKGDREAASAAWTAARKLSPRNLNVHTLLITNALQAADDGLAKAHMRALQAQWPNHPQTRYLSALFAFQSKEYARVRELSQQVLRDAPDDTRVLYLAALAELLSDGSLTQAEQLASKLLSLAPDNDGFRLLVARIQHKRGDSVRSLATLKPLLTGERVQTADVWALAGEAAMATGRSGDAQRYYAKAVNLSPDSLQVQTSFALAQLAMGQREQGLSALQRIASKDQGGAADVALARASLSRGDYPAALRAVDGLARKLPKDPLPSHIRGEIEQRRSNVVEARKAYEAALALDESYFPALVNLVGLDIQAKAFDAADKRMQAALKKKPKDLSLLLADWTFRRERGEASDKLSDRMREIVKVHPSVPGPRVALVTHELMSNRPQQALSAAQDAAAALPNEPRVLEVLAQAQMANGNRDLAIASLGRLLTLRPDDQINALRLMELHLQLKDTAAAATVLRRALGTRSDDLQLQRSLILVELQRQQVGAAREVVATVKKQRHDEPAGFVLEGDLEQLQRNWVGAAKAYTAALAKAKGDLPEIEIKLHGVLLEAGRKDDAAAMEARWRRTAKGEHEVAYLTYLGDRAMHGANPEKAIDLYAQVLKREPHRATALNNMALLQSRAGKHAEAKEMAERLNKQYPGQGSFLDTWAEVQANAGDWAGAVELQRKALQASNGRPDVRMRLARYLIEAGQKGEARKQVQMLVDLGEKFPDRDALKKLQAQL